MVSFGLKIQRLRAAKGLGLRVLGKRSGMSASYLSLIERGIMPPPANDKLERLGAELGIPRDAIYIMAGRLRPELLELVGNRPADATRALEAELRKR